MPQIQIIPGSPGFGSQLGAALGQGLGGGINQGISFALSQMLEQKAQQQKTSQLLGALGLGSAQPGLEAQAGIETARPSSSKMPNLTQEQVLAGSIINPALAPALSSIYKNQQKEAKDAQSEETAQHSLDRMSELLSQGKLGLGSKMKGKVFGGETAESVGEFESLSGALEAQLVDKVSRGTLSNARFKYITETLLPKPNDREATIRGKLKALSKELNLQLPKTLDSKMLTSEKAQDFLNQAKGDKEKARKIARAKGYDF